MASTTQTQLVQTLRDSYSKIERIDPCGEAYGKLIAFLDTLDEKTLTVIHTSNIKFVSLLALNRLIRKFNYQPVVASNV